MAMARTIEQVAEEVLFNGLSSFKNHVGYAVLNAAECRTWEMPGFAILAIFSLNANLVTVLPKSGDLLHRGIYGQGARRT
jgi:hypothetical protein